MPGFPFPGRPGGEHDEPLLDMIIARRVLPPDAPQPMHDLARMLAALAGPAEPGELAGEVAVRAAFSRAASPASISPAARQPGRRRRTRRSRRFRGPARSRVRLATALVAAAAALGSVFAAYLDVLPSPIQQLAHVTVAAPAPPSTAPQQSRTQRRGRTAPGKAPVTSAPASHPTPSPDRSAGSAPNPGQGIFLKPSYKPRATGSAGRGVAGPICTPSPWPSPSTPGKPSAHPSPSSSQVSQGEHCTGLPTGPSGEPTLNPYAPLTGAQSVTTAA
jgi:hypothetical protein